MDALGVELVAAVPVLSSGELPARADAARPAGRGRASIPTARVVPLADFVVAAPDALPETAVSVGAHAERLGLRLRRAHHPGDPGPLYPALDSWAADEGGVCPALRVARDAGAVRPGDLLVQVGSGAAVHAGPGPGPAPSLQGTAGRFGPPLLELLARRPLTLVFARPPGTPDDAGRPRLDPGVAGVEVVPAGLLLVPRARPAGAGAGVAAPDVLTDMFTKRKCGRVSAGAAVCLVLVVALVVFCYFQFFRAVQGNVVEVDDGFGGL